MRDEGLAPVFYQLDVRDGDQVGEAAETLRERHGGVDIAVSNAALRRTRDSSDAATIRAFIDTNNHGAHRMIRGFGPILNDGARFIVVASAFGRLQYLRGELRPRLDPATMTLEDLEKLLAEYAALDEAGQDRAVVRRHVLGPVTRRRRGGRGLAGATELYGELVQHRVVLGYDAR